MVDKNKLVLVCQNRQTKNSKVDSPIKAIDILDIVKTVWIGWVDCLTIDSGTVWDSIMSGLYSSLPASDGCRDFSSRESLS